MMPVPSGGFISSTMMVMMPASTPSLKASIRPLVIHTPFWFELKPEPPLCGVPTLFEASGARMLQIVRSPSRPREYPRGLTHTGSVQERFPVAWNSPRWARCRLAGRMRMRRQQFHALDHPLLFVVEKPVLTRFEACDHRLSIEKSWARDSDHLYYR